MYYRRGFISFRTIVALIITLSILPLSVYALAYSANLKFNYDEINDEIALLQLRRILLIVYDVNNNGYSLDFIYHNNNYTLSLINNRLVLQPGYQMFLDNINNLEFFEDGNSIYIRYEKRNKEYTAPIIKQKGIYLDDFSDNYDDSDVYSYDDEWIYY